MAVVFPTDDILGPVAWSEAHRSWTFAAGPSILGQIIPEAERTLPAEDGLRRIRACVMWLRDNEPQLRHRVASDMFDYWCEAYRNDEDEVNSPEAFAAAIRTIGINFTENGEAEVFYDDAGLFGNHGIWVEIDPEGRFVEGPDFA